VLLFRCGLGFIGFGAEGGASSCGAMKACTLSTRPKFGLRPLRRSGTKLGSLTAAVPKRGRFHAATGQEGFDVGQELLSMCHGELEYRTIPTLQEARTYFPKNRFVPISSGMDTVRQLILEKVPNLKAMSLSIGKSHSYLQQFVHRGVPVKLPEDVREALAPKIGVNPDDLRQGRANPEKPRCTNTG
jgi:hypothetical protein